MTPLLQKPSGVLDAFVKDLRKTGKIAGVVHKKPITKQQIQRLYECGELNSANSTNPAQLQRTVWFYLVLYFGQRGRETQRQMKSIMLLFSFHRMHVVDRSAHDRSTISATATSKFTTTTASPAEQLIADIVTPFVRSKL